MITLGTGIAAGLALGSVYALIALSFTLVIAATSFFNFAIESLVALGGVAAYVFAHQWHLDVALTVVLVCVGGAIAGGLMELVAHRPFEGRTKNVGLAVLLGTAGLSIAIDAEGGILFGNSPRAVPPYVSTDPLHIGKVPIPPYYIVMIAAMLILALGFEAALQFTSVGRSLRAMQEDQEGLSLLGQNVKLKITLVFALSGLFAAVGGFLITPVSSASPSSGTQLVVPAFAALAIGGFGSFRGAIGGGLLTGLVAGIMPLYAPTSWTNPILFLVIVLILIIKPTGFFGIGTVREV